MQESPKPRGVPVAEGEVDGQVPFRGTLSPVEKGTAHSSRQRKKERSEDKERMGREEGRGRGRWRKRRK